MNHIVYISKIAAIFTISVNDRTLMSHEFLNEQRNHRSICPEWILTTTENIEIS